MHSTDSLLVAIYGTTAAAAEKLEVGRSSFSNWKKWGYFPERMVGRLLRDAPPSLKLTADQIPTMTNRPAPA